MTKELDTLATALYVRIDDTLKASPQLAPYRPAVGIAPRISDAELITLAVSAALLGFVKERRWLRHVRAHLLDMFPYVPGQSGYNKRLRKLAAVTTTMIRVLAVDTSLWSDDVWVVDPTPVECGRSRDTTRRSDVAGWAEYGYCASHSRYFWGLRLHLVCTLGGLPIMFGLTGAKADERETLLAMFGQAPDVMADHRRQTLIGDKNYFGAGFEADLAAGGVNLLRPARKGEQPRSGDQFFRPLRQTIESINQTLKGQLDLERHGGRTVEGVWIRILARILALTAVIWHNDHTGIPIKRSLIAYDT